MGDKNSYPNSEFGGDGINKKLKGSYEVLGGEVFQPDKNFEKGLDINFNKPSEIKTETDFELLSGLFNSTTPQSSRMLKKVIAPASTPRNITVKREITIEKTINMPSTKLSTFKPTTIRLARPLNTQISEGDDKNQVSTDENKNEGNVIRLTTKPISDQERKRLRAKRFNIVAESLENDEVTITRTVSNPVFDRINILASNPTPIFKTLKKRAERFGENVSSVMKSLEYREKMLKRKLKFLESVTNLKELEMEEQRTERFIV